MTGVPLLGVGDQIRLDGRVRTIVGLDGPSVRLVDVTGAAEVMLRGQVLADPSFELVTAARISLPPLAELERLPTEIRIKAEWWEQHVVEVLTGVPPGARAHSTPRAEYDPARRSLRQRELAKHAALTAAGHQVGLSTLKRLRRRYELQGLWGLVDQRHVPTVRGGPPTGRVDPRVVAATRQAIAEATDRSTGTVDRLRRRVEQLLAAEPAPPTLPSRRTFYRLVARLSAGKHTFDSARTRRSLAKQPEGPFGVFTAARPGEWTQIDSTPLDVRVVLDDGLVDRVELTGLVDVATRTVAAAVLRPTTKAVDAALLLARALTPADAPGLGGRAAHVPLGVAPHEPDRDRSTFGACGGPPRDRPGDDLCDHGKAYLSATFRAACRSLGISLQPAHPDTPTDKPMVERTLGSVGTLFAQYVAGYVGSSVERRGRHAEQGAVWSMAELQALLDEWIVAVWQNRPHEGLRDPLTPDRALTPNERYAAAITHAGYIPVPLSPSDYVELLPTIWRTINSYGIKIRRRTYDAAALNPYRRQHSAVAGKRGLWQVHYDPYDISRVWVRNHHSDDPTQRFIQASWTHLRTAPVPFGEATWTHARQLLSARGQDPATEAQIAAAAAHLLDIAERGPEAPDTARTTKTNGPHRSKRTRRMTGRERATAAASWPRPVTDAEPSEPHGPTGQPIDQSEPTGPDRPRDGQSGDEAEPVQLAKVVALPLFDARKEAQKWW